MLLISQWLDGVPVASDGRHTFSWRALWCWIALFVVVLMSSAGLQVWYAFRSGDIGYTSWMAGFWGLHGDMYDGEGAVHTLGLAWWMLCEALPVIGVIGLMLCRINVRALRTFHIFAWCSAVGLGLILGVGIARLLPVVIGYEPEGGWSDLYSGTTGIVLDENGFSFGGITGILFKAAAVVMSYVLYRCMISSRRSSNHVSQVAAGFSSIVVSAGLLGSSLLSFGVSERLIGVLVEFFLAFVWLPCDLTAVRRAINERRDARWLIVPAVSLTLATMALVLI